MCQFMSSLPRRSKSNSSGKKRSSIMSLKPCADDKTFYRVRLLAFGPSAASGSDRDDPWIERFIHQHWEPVAGKNYSQPVDEVICPVTPHVHVDGDKYDSCKICNLANKFFLTFKESGWKDKDANRKNKEFGRKYQACIPVYVVNNPNWEGDNNHFRVMVFNDKKFYQEFRKKVEAAQRTNQVFNGKNAVDCCLHVKDEVEILNPGQPNERKWTKRVIDRVVFSTKPYTIDAITREAVDAMGFDDEFYQSSTMDEIDAFYKKYCTVSNDDIPMDDITPVYEPQPTQAKVETVNNDMPVASAKPSVSDIDDLTSDSDDLPAVSEPSQSASSDIDADKLMAELGL